MKNLLAFIISFLSIITFAQHPDLQQRWYVQNITIDNVTTEIPIDPVEFPFVYLDFLLVSSGSLETTNFQSDENCKINLFGEINYTSTDIFEFVDHEIFSTTTACNPTMIDFMDLYIGFFEDSISEQFSYSITTETDNSKTLVISKDLGDIVTFTNSFFDETPVEISNTTWYLYNLIIDGEDNFTPIFENEPISGGCLAFFLDDGSAVCYFDACWSMVCRAYFDTTLEHFYLFIDASTLSDCNSSVYSDYTYLYNEFFENSIYSAFSYSVSDNGETKSLIITNSNGDQAIYGNTALATQDFSEANITIYPNPVMDFLYVENETEEITKIEVMDLLGKIVITKLDSFNQIDLTNFTSGVYVVKFYAGEAVLTKKVIKK